MKSILLIKLCLFISIVSVSRDVLAEKKVFTDYDAKNDICKSSTKHSSIKKACKSKSPPKNKIYECKKKCLKRKFLGCKKHEWKLKKVGQCSKDGEKKGYYVGTCGGTPIKATSMKKACAAKAAKGNTVVYCKNGKEKKRQACSSAKNNDSDKYETKVFITKCGGKNIATSKNGKPITRNINKACKTGKYNDKTLVRCKNKCTKRKGLKCKKKTWIEKEKKICGKNKSTAKVMNCNENETRAILTAYKNAATNVKMVKKAAEKFIRNPDKYFSDRGISVKEKQKKTILGRAKKSKDNLGKILQMLNKKKSKFYCPGESKSCQGAYAYTFQTRNKKLWFCPGFFTSADDTGDVKLDQIGTLVHEYSHNKGSGTDDLEYSREKIKNVDWSNNGETYEAWVEAKDFCVPGYDKECMISEIRKSR